MARHLDPNVIALKEKLQKGMLVSLPQKTPDGKSTESRALKFQYNPETVTRTRAGQWEVGKKKDPAQNKALQDAHRGGGLLAKSETLSLKIIFDATEAILGPNPSQYETDGVLPELAVLEGMALGKEATGEEEKKDAPLISLNPTELLLVLGQRRFPVVVTSMTIAEQRFNLQLVPNRAEIDLRLRVLEVSENLANSKVRQTFEQLRQDRYDQSTKAAYTGTDEKEAIAKALDPSANEGALQKALDAALKPIPDTLGGDR